MFICELKGYIEFIIDISFVEKLKLSFSNHFYSSNTHLKNITVTLF